MKNLDKYAICLGYTALVIALIILSAKGFHPVYSVAAIIGIIAIATYTAFRNNLVGRINISADSNRVSLIAIVGAVACVTLAITTYWLRPSPYEKPLAYYVLLAIASGLLFYSTTTGNNRWQQHSIVAISCAIGLIHIWTETLMFPGLIGIDPWLHMRVVTQEIANSRITLSGLGIYPSAWHFYLKQMIDWSGLEYRIAALAFVGSIQMIGNIILASLIGRKLFNTETGAVAALVLSFANWNITFGEWIIPSGIGATYAMATAYLILVLKKHDLIRILAVSGLVILGVFTHTLAMAWVIGTIVCFLVFPVVFDTHLGIKYKLTKLVVNNIVTLAIATAAVIWLVNTTSGTATLATLVNSSPYAAFGTTSTTSETIVPGMAVNSLNHEMIGETVINSIGMLVYIGVALFGVLAMLRDDKTRITYAILCVAALAIGFVPTLLGLPFLDDRWRYLAMVLMSIPTAHALLGMVNIKSGTATTTIVTVLVAGMAFFNTIGWWSNMTQRTLSPNQVVRYALTGGEMYGLEEAEKHNPKVLGVDPYYLAFVQSRPNWNGSTVRGPMYLDSNLLSGDFHNCKADVILLREAVWKEPFAFGSGAIYKLEYNPVEIAKTQGYTEVWNNEEIHCLVRAIK